MTIEQTVEIPANRRITFDLPPQTPMGKARVEVKVIPFVKQEDMPDSDPQSATADSKSFLERADDKAVDNGKIRFTRKELDEMLKDCPITQRLTGILHTDMTLDEIRMERLAKHL
jgi:hypothetical protein